MSEKDARIPKRGWIGIGLVSGVIALFFVPIVFGLVSVFAGYNIYKRDELIGLGVVVFGGVCMILGVVMGFLAGV